MNPVTWLGGVIIEIVGEMALMHHGGYSDADDEHVHEPIEVPWSTRNGAMTFDLRGWACRPMEIIEGDHRTMLLKPDLSVFVIDGMLSVTP